MVDAAAAAVATVVTLAILSQGGLGTPSAINRAFDELGLVLTLATGLPLAFARRWPGVVFAISAGASIALMYLHYPLDVPPGPLYAGYVLALAWGGAGRLRRGLAVAGVVGYVPAVAVALGFSGIDVWSVTTELSTWGMAMVGVWLGADRTRLRQAEIDAAEERASRTEREAVRENRLAAAEERTRIARELHDSAGHAINVILVQAGAARLLHERDPAASLRALETVEDVARATIVDIDRMVHALRSDDGEPVPANPAVLEELLDHHRRSGLQLATTFGGERRPLPRSVAWAAYRILQEALTNAARHGSGSAEVTVGFGAQAMEITVSNRMPATVGAGSHAPVAHRPDGGHGLVGMRERAMLLGGTFAAAADAGVFHVNVRLPYDATRASR